MMLIFGMKKILLGEIIVSNKRYHVFLDVPEFQVKRKGIAYKEITESKYGVNLKEVHVGSKIRIRVAKVWKGIWTVKKDWKSYIVVQRIRSNGRNWQMCIGIENIYEHIINPSRRMN